MFDSIENSPDSEAKYNDLKNEFFETFLANNLDSLCSGPFSRHLGQDLDFYNEGDGIEGFSNIGQSPKPNSKYSFFEPYENSTFDDILGQTAQKRTAYPSTISKNLSSPCLADTIPSKFRISLKNKDLVPKSLQEDFYNIEIKDHYSSPMASVQDDDDVSLNLMWNKAKFPQNNKTPIKSSYNETASFTSPYEENSFYKKEKSAKGLRYLSKKVNEIVLREKKSTYKNVAEILIKSLAQNDKLNGVRGKVWIHFK